MTDFSKPWLGVHSAGLIRDRTNLLEIAHPHFFKRSTLKIVNDNSKNCISATLSMQQFSLPNEAPSPKPPPKQLRIGGS